MTFVSYITLVEWTSLKVKPYRTQTDAARMASPLPRRRINIYGYICDHPDKSELYIKLIDQFFLIRLY